MRTGRNGHSALQVLRGIAVAPVPPHVIAAELHEIAVDQESAPAAEIRPYADRQQTGQRRVECEVMVVADACRSAYGGSARSAKRNLVADVIEDGQRLRCWRVTWDTERQREIRADRISRVRRHVTIPLPGFEGDARRGDVWL